MVAAGKVTHAERSSKCVHAEGVSDPYMSSFSSSDQQLRPDRSVLQGKLVAAERHFKHPNPGDNWTLCDLLLQQRLLITAIFSFLLFFHMHEESSDPQKKCSLMFPEIAES